MTSTAALRQKYLDYFARQGHEVVASSPLVPGNDPTLLFTNAGMVQFKETFLGQETRSYVRATSSQRCVRAGGKHNDLENVGYTARHHTFFEMLGNFSFGDYFKHDAIRFAWEFLTQDLGLPKERLWVTVYDEDDEAAHIWLKEIGIAPEQLIRIGDKPGGKRYESDNFWSMGDTGPCGPCSEIFYDHGEDVAGGLPGSPDEDGDRYIEIWNLVFMQYNRSADGAMAKLPKPSVDTGMGLERLAAVMQGVHSNYEIDLFANLIKAIARVTNTDDLKNNSLRVIADHIRSCSFLITDGVMPSNEGRGYVLRRVIRRAIRHAYQLGVNEAFYFKLVVPLVSEMGEAYPELAKAQPQIEKVLKLEEERFAETLDQGMKILESAIADLKGKEIPGATVFKLYDTYGFPADLTADIARERGLVIDDVGFEREMEAQRERARSASQFGVDYSASVEVDVASEFTGYEHIDGEANVVALISGESQVDSLSANEEGVVILDKTPFYAESGGQAGDRGALSANGVEFSVSDTRKLSGVNGHIGKVNAGKIKVGMTLTVDVDQTRRQSIILNHSATHLLHAALRQVLGEHVTQKGSLVEADRLRFDFSHFEPVTKKQISEIERIVNAAVRANNAVQTRLMSYDDAVEAGAMALFGEKYTEEVRVLSIGEFSTELCGGIHAERAGDIGLFKIILETGTAAGVRRIEAVTGEHAVAWLEQLESNFASVSALVKGGREDTLDKVQQLVDKSRKLEKELEQLKGKLASSQGSELAEQAIEINGIKLLAAKLEGADAKTLRNTVDQLKNKLGSAVIVLGAVVGEKVSLTAGVTPDLIKQVKAGDLVKHVAQQVGGKGGGRPDMAQAGGTEPAGLDAALASVKEWVEERSA
ncbi:Alanyl-tRNA synthetase [hydrothermal vent metagenome]|uniref:Alanine--tRNA ligase n=1 Tax=hydrothermal vent metagenome TaxID=652676 RepID=A0A3B0ZLX2_9ZZZZ